jgi:UDP-glucose 4-epimerase
VTRRTVRDSAFLVTGGAGFIGSHLVDRLLEEGAASVLCVDDLSLGRRENVHRDAELVQIDCADLGALRGAVGGRTFDACFNMAVIPLPASLERPKETVDRNVAMTTAVCELSRGETVGTLVQLSSSEVYGSVEEGAIDEEHPHAGTTPYAASKSATDLVAQAYQRTFGCDVALVRPFNTYGPRQNKGGYAGLLPTVISRVAAGEPIVIDGDGRQTRDFLFVEDTARGAVAAYERLAGDGTVVNLGSGEERSVNDVVEALLGALGAPDWPVLYGPPRPGDVRRHLADTSRARALLDFLPRVAFSAGIERTVAWYRAQDAEPPIV